MVLLRGRPDRFLVAFLDCLLDKHDGRFHNRTYLALPLLDQMLADPANGIDATTMAQHLVADIVRHELAAASDATPDDNENTDRPSPRTLRTRVRHALRFVTDADLPADITRAVDLLPAPPAGTAGEWFDLTVQPVSVLHDEYFFIRVLQAHEMVFTVLSEDVLAAAAALRAGSVADALTHLDHATALFGRAVLLFRIVATMRTATFTEFREYTQGASAIQSAQYKRFELACGEPTVQRLRSGAFADVPVVGAVVDAMADRADDLSRAYLDALCAGSFICADWDALDTRLAALEACHQRWKAAHVGLASRMLGDAAGSGYTAGVPYLQGCLDNRLFWQLGAS
jgi:tryptophan 2,3-dioxygenase